MKRRIQKAPNNNHFVQLFADFPELTSAEVGRALGASGTAVSSWRSGQRDCPLWTVAVVEKFRQEYAEGKESVRAKRVAKNALRKKEEGLEFSKAVCIICGPRSKLDKLTTVLSLFGYSILDSE